jgi:hypothetical protein
VAEKHGEERLRNARTTIVDRVASEEAADKNQLINNLFCIEHTVFGDYRSLYYNIVTLDDLIKEVMRIDNDLYKLELEN